MQRIEHHHTGRRYDWRRGRAALAALTMVLPTIAALTIAVPTIAVVATLAAPRAHAESQEIHYSVTYRVELLPTKDVARVAIILAGPAAAIPSQIAFSINPSRYSGFTGDGGIDMSDRERIVWEPPNTGGRIEYDFKVDHQRSDLGYDSYMTSDWAIFRADRMVPPVSVRAAARAVSDATLEFVLPRNWSVMTPYPEVREQRGRFDDPTRRFDRPKGWLIAGAIGLRREAISGVEIVVAGPTEQGLRRLDLLAVLTWTFPQLANIFHDLPPRVLLVTARDPMWRGGLSGPASLFLHGDRPIFSENRTSTLLHELVHVASGIHGDDESDWVVEGLAEYYSVEIVRRSGGMSDRRFGEAMAKLAEWSRNVDNIFVKRSAGKITARAVGIMHAADVEIRAASEGKQSLDDVAGELSRVHKPITLELFQQLAAKAAGRKVDALSRDNLPGGTRG